MTENVDARGDTFVQIISGARRGIWANILRAGLRLMSWAYGFATFTRNRMFDVGIKKTHRVPAPVISIGNLTAGGTGKTPFVAYVVDWLLRRGIRPAIVSRGYRAIEQDETGEVVNDEKRVLNALCPGVPHVQNANRVVAATRAVSHHNGQVIVLDDGFQHRRLHRDLDIVLIDATNPFGHGFVLPRGLMRESMAGLGRADVLAITRCEQVEAEVVDGIERRLRKFTDAPIIHTRFEPTRLMSVDKQPQPITEWRERPAVAFCGIGNPGGFWKTLAQANITCVETREFADHHHYEESQIAELRELARSAGSSWLVTTTKDMVKIPAAWSDEIPVYAVDIELRVDEQDEDILFKRLMQATGGESR